MRYICPLCEKAINHDEAKCEKKDEWFLKLSGKGIWRIRFLNKYEYQFLTDEDFQKLLAHPLTILDEANHWDNFNPSDYYGTNSVGIRTSIFCQ